MAGKKTKIGKATGIGSSAVTSTVGLLASSLQSTTSIAGIVDPPYEPQKLVMLFELSSCLRQHIEAIITNVDSFGWKFDPAINFDAPDALERVRDSLYHERIAAAELRNEPLEDVPVPSSAEATTRMTNLERTAKIELNKLRSFFSFISPEGSFIELRARTRQDLEITGNAYWEVLRDRAKRVARIVLAPVTAMRLTPIDKVQTEVDERVPVSEVEWTTVKQHKFFRRFVEINPEQKKVRAYFKEFGDPRVVSRMTGKIYATAAEFKADTKKPKDDQEATEVIHFTIPSPRSAYGVPRWMGNLPAILGSRELDEVNLAYFENKTVPPLALLVAGGRLSKGVVPRIEEFIEQNLKGRKNFHKILVLEAEGQKSAGSASGIIPTIKFQPLREAQQQDALFQSYDEANWQKVGSSFRLPRILVGRDKQINRATASASIRFAEEQVFGPIRNAFDEFINRRLLPELKVTFWRFKSNTPITRDPELLSAIIAELSDAGIITPAEGREISSDVFNRELPQLDAAWTKQPFKLTLVQAKTAAGAGGHDEALGRPAGSTVRDAVSRQETEGAPVDEPAAPAATSVKKRIVLPEV